jgi:aminopeptidase N
MGVGLVNATIILVMLSLSASWATAAGRRYTVLHYGVRLTLDFEKRSVEGVETIRLRSHSGSLTDVELDADEIAVNSVQLGVSPQAFSQGDGHLTIHLALPLKPSKSLNVTMRYSGSPTKGLRFSRDEAFTVYATSHWMVVNRDPGDLATLRLALTVPAGMVVVANGENTSRKTVGSQLISQWEEKRAIPDFVFGFAVGRFHQNAMAAGQAEVRCFSAKYSAQQMNQMFRTTPDALAFFSERAGVPYPAKTYSQVMVGGKPEQELGEFTLLPESYGETLRARPEDEWLMAHELAHQWWGIGLACGTWGDFWLNEGIATFMADVWLGERYGAARYEKEIESAHKIYEGLKETGKDHALCYAGKAENEVSGRLPYDKGAWVLHLLRQDVGEEVFWHGFRIYTRTHMGQTVSSKDFQNAMEKAAGRSLGKFFEEWVY